MGGFLAQVAADLMDRYGDGVSSLSMVFPSRRAALFFGEALSEVITRPLWQPASVTVDSIAEELSGLSTGNRLHLLTELYKIYTENHPGESFDDFYFWGELLLSDFDSIDKYLIDADTLFSDLVDLHELDNRFDYLEPEQKAVIEKFWGSFGKTAADDGQSAEQRDFLAMWRTLAPIYHRFKARLGELGIAYQGMVYREAAERIMSDRVPQIPERHYVIAGFNALGKCEQVIFDYLRRRFEVDFYWDYDEYYTGDTPLALAQEAGRFMRDNLRKFPPASHLSGGFDNFAKPKTIRSVAAASDVLQCKYAGIALGNIARAKGSAPDKETAVVLCDESLLSPLLWSIPPEIENINITMGYPLWMHPTYTFVERLVELQNRRRTTRNSLAFYHSDVEGLLRHPYLTPATTRSFKSRYVYINAQRLRTTPIFEAIFTAPDGRREMSDYLLRVISRVAQLPFAGGEDGTSGGVGRRTEFFAVIVEHIRTLAASLEGCDISVSPKIYATLLRRSLQSVTVPFEGEPLAGVQVMGILETRALDFENMILLSMNDSNAPGDLTGAPSFIPYNLKMAYGLPTPEHHEGVWAYHFTRLIQRARHVEMVWSRTADDRSTGEPSRYILQLDYESPHTIEKAGITVDVNLSQSEAITVEKDPEIMERLGEFLSTGDPSRPSVRRLSPSLFYTYIECPLKFYFRGVARLKPEEAVSEEIDGATFGNILHRAMQLLYAPLVGMPRPQKPIGALRGSSAVKRAVQDAMKELYTKQEGALPEDWGGDQVLVHKIITDYIDHGILPFDAGRGEAFEIEKLEQRIEAEVSFGATKTVVFSGIADRMDRLSDGIQTVVDYKTGNPKNNASALLQMKLYAMILGKNGHAKVHPMLYYVRDMSRPDYSPPVVGSDEDFEENLCRALAELFDPGVPFTRCDDPKPCEWCEYNTICRRV